MLIFDSSQIKNRARGLTFDDVLIMPARSDVRSRRDPHLTTQLTQNLIIDTPIVSSNMDTITESAMAIAMAKQGGVGILHRFLSIEAQVHELSLMKEAGLKILGASIGVGDDFQERSRALVAAGCNLITIDIAHGHSVAMIETMKWIKDSFTDIEIIAGNVATPEGVYDLAQAGAGAIKVGIGPGSMCTTRVITGCGVPQLTAIALCYEAASGVPIIADGGIRTSGDIVKAFAAGASTVMLGSMLAGTLETPGEIKQGKKQYRGMASKAAQVSWRGGVPQGMAAEGESTYVSLKGHVKDVIFELTGGIRSGMSYISASSVGEIVSRARFIEMTAAGTRESRAHGL